MFSTVLPSRTVCLAMAARALPRLATSRALPVAARFLWLLWNSATSSPMIGLAMTMPQTTSLSSFAAAVPNNEEMRVKASIVSG